MSLSEKEFVDLPEQSYLPGCALVLDLKTLTVTVSYPDMRVYTITLAGLLKSLPKP